MDVIDIAIGQLAYRDVLVPRRFVERWQGMKRRRGAMLFQTSSVHGFGMDRDLTVVVVGSDETVVDVRTLHPGRLIVVRGAKWMLETESFLPCPVPGDPIRFYDRSDGGTSRGVRHSDRKLGRHLGASHSDAPGR